MTRLARWFVKVLVVATVATTSPVAPVEAAPSSRQTCRHPHPCGDEWPVGLRGPFELREVVHVRVPSFDGVELEGWIGLPRLPRGVRAPVALHSTPYLGTCYVLAGGCLATPGQPSFWEPDAPELDWGVSARRVVEQGYAAAFFSVRGTGNSGGCYELFGPKEQRDQAVLVQWLARQPWSNGRVAMGGVSYPGTTALEAAIQSPPALKTVVVAGIVSDNYTFGHTPQGATVTLNPAFTALADPSITLPPPMGGGLAHGTVGHLPVLPERVCDEVVEVFTEEWRGWLTDARDARFADDRRLIDRFDEVTAAVLLAQGFDDILGHGFQESAAWRALTRAPKRMVEGQWGHRFPTPDAAQLDRRWQHSEWDALLFAWLDYWLKGIGRAPRLGLADYQDDTGTWHSSRAWPPAEARSHALYTAGARLATRPGGAARSFRSSPNLLNSHHGAHSVGLGYDPWHTLCEGDTPTGVAYRTAPLGRDVLIAGNPFAYLRLESDQPGGIVAVHVAALGPDFSCNGLHQPSGLRPLTWGAADLRFHRGNFVGRPFPTGRAVAVRIDLLDLAARIPAGHRVAMVIDYGETHAEWSGQPYFPEITVRSDGGLRATHLVLPVVRGSLGVATSVAYPPRPFVPR